MVGGSAEKDPEPSEANESLMRVRLENYHPRTEDLKKYCEEAPDPEEFLRKLIDTYETRIKAATRKFADPALDTDNRIPRKGNWDMKRSLAPKLKRLEQRTHRAIIRIAQQKAKEARQLTAPQTPPTSSDDET